MFEELGVQKNTRITMYPTIIDHTWKDNSLYYCYDKFLLCNYSTYLWKKIRNFIQNVKHLWAVFILCNQALCYLSLCKYAILFTHRAPRSSQELGQKCLCIPRLNWNLEKLVSEERVKPEYLEENLSEKSREPTKYSTHMMLGLGIEIQDLYSSVEICQSTTSLGYTRLAGSLAQVDN